MATAAPTTRPPAGAFVWFVFMIGSWVAFAALSVTAEGALADIWQWVGDLPLAAEIVAWFLTLPWMLALAVWESAWSDPVRVLLVATIAAGWTIISVPRTAKPD